MLSDLINEYRKAIGIMRKAKVMKELIPFYSISVASLGEAGGLSIDDQMLIVWYTSEYRGIKEIPETDEAIDFLKELYVQENK